MSDCLFCRILAKELPSRVLLEDERAIVIEDKFPQAPVHVLVIPRKHYDSLRDAGEAERDLLGHCLLVANRAAKAKGIDGPGYRVMTNVGTDGGQAIAHLHFHVLGGRKLGAKIVATP